MVLPDFENKYYLKDNESNYTLRNHKSCQKPWHGQRQNFNRFCVICTTLKWDITGLGLQPRVSFSLLFYFGSLSLLFSTTTLSNGNSCKFYGRVKAIFSAVTTLTTTVQ